jgi:hypothetical protein
VLDQLRQPLRLLHGKLVQQHLIEESEYPGIGADAQRQRKNRDGTEDWRLRERPAGIAHVSEKARHYHRVRIWPIPGSRLVYAWPAFYTLSASKPRVGAATTGSGHAPPAFPDD